MRLYKYRINKELGLGLNNEKIDAENILLWASAWKYTIFLAQEIQFIGLK